VAFDDSKRIAYICARPVDRSVQYVLIGYGERLAMAKIAPLVSSFGDSDDNAFAATIKKLYEHRRDSSSAMANASGDGTAEVDRGGLIQSSAVASPISNIPPAESIYDARTAEQKQAV
jgi:transposase InsO family protein